MSFNPAQEEGEGFEEQGEGFEEQGRSSQENGPGWSEAQAQHRISQQLLPPAGGRLIYAVRQAAAWGQRGVRIWERKH